MPEQSFPIFSARLDSSVREALPYLRPVLPEFNAAIVRVLDSTVEPAEISRALDRFAVRNICTRNGALIERASLYTAVEQNVFHGFDEVWLFKRMPGEEFSIPNDIYLTSDATDLSDSVPATLERLILLDACILVLGDGCGLNYMTVDENLDRALREAFPIAET